VSGAETRAGNRFDAENLYLAYVLQRSLRKELGVEDRGVHRARFAVLCPAVMPSVLIEGGFMSNPAESKKIYDAGYRRQMAKAIVDGVQSYQRQVQQ
jgi:N-acetylmuramoyl-L-alanine amidase